MKTWLRGQFRTEATESLSQVEKGKLFFENSIVRSLLLMQTVLVVAIVGFFAFLLRPTEALTVLHYNVYFGVDLLGAWWQTFILPGIALIFVGMNLALAYRFYTKQHERIAAYLILLGSAMLLSGVALGCIAIGYINY